MVRNSVRITLERNGMDLFYNYDGTRAFYRDDPEQAVDVYRADDPDVIESWSRLLPYLDQVRTYLPDLEPVDAGP